MSRDFSEVEWDGQLVGEAVEELCFASQGWATGVPASLSAAPGQVETSSLPICCRWQWVAVICCPPLAWLCQKYKAGQIRTCLEGWSFRISISLSLLVAGWWQQKEGSYGKSWLHSWAPWGKAACCAAALGWRVTLTELGETGFKEARCAAARNAERFAAGSSPLCWGDFLASSCWNRTQCHCTTQSCNLAWGSCG